MAARLLPLLFISCIIFCAWTLQAATPSIAGACPMPPAESETIPFALGGSMSAELQVAYYEELAASEDEIACEAWIRVPLSAFPTWRVSTRPSDVAPAIRETAKRWGARECRVVVLLHNDTGEDLSEGDDCVVGSFRFEGIDWWASSSEQRCMDLAVEANET